MAIIKNLILKSVDLIPEVIARDMIKKKLLESGNDIPPSAVDALVKHILSGNGDDFTWNDGNGGPYIKLSLNFDEADLAELERKFKIGLEAIPDAVREASDRVGESVFASMRERWPAEKAMQGYEDAEFRERLEQRWGTGLDYLRMLLAGCRDVGRETCRRHNKSKSQRHKYRRWVLVRLHARACQTTDEIICLMENGFADGAMARWRTLHELSVVAALIADGDEDLAERYILHDAVEVKRQADDYEESQVPLGYKSINAKIRAQIELRFKAVINRFGPQFIHPFGWASKYLNHKKPTFKHLQIAVGRDGMRSHYKMASFNVHVSARSLFFNLTSFNTRDTVNAGRSNAGLVDPGERTAQSLLFITGVYAGDTRNLDWTISLGGLIRVRDEVGPALARAERRLVRDERSVQKTVAARRKANASKK